MDRAARNATAKCTGSTSTETLVAKYPHNLPNRKMARQNGVSASVVEASEESRGYQGPQK